MTKVYFIIMGIMALAITVLTFIIKRKNKKYDTAQKTIKMFETLYSEAVNHNKIMQETIAKIQKTDKIKLEEKEKADEKINAVHSGSDVERFNAINSELQNNTDGKK